MVAQGQKAVKSGRLGPMDRRTLGIVIAIGGIVAAGAGAAIAASSRKRVLGGLRGAGLGRADMNRMLRGQVSNADKTTKVYRGDKISIDERVGILQELTARAVKDPEMSKLARAITGSGGQVTFGTRRIVVRGANCKPRDSKCEARAIYDWKRKNLRYTGDIAPHVLSFADTGGKRVIEAVDLFKTPMKTIEDGGGDCLPLDTLVLRSDWRFVAIADLRPGDRIMASGAWTTVQDVWATGEKEILEFDLNNGCILRCSPDHRVFRNVDGREEEVRAEQVRPGDFLVTPERIHPTSPSPAHEGLAGAELARLIGLYVADGWHEVYRFAISGRDGKPKEAQKKEMQELFARLGVPTRWHDRYLAVNSKPWAQYLAQFGGKATSKTAPLAWSTEAEVEALLSGLAADASHAVTPNGDTLTYGTTSPELALQLRVLHRMLGRSVHIKRVDDHGGLGKNPIYRVTARSLESTNGRSRLKVRGVRTGEPEMCADLTVDTGRFWLPESDVMVHNCDEQAPVGAALAILNGIPAKFVVSSMEKRPSDDEWSHIWDEVFLGAPKNGPSKWAAIDSTLEGDYFGVSAPAAARKEFPA